MFPNGYVIDLFFPLPGRIASCVFTAAPSSLGHHSTVQDQQCHLQRPDTEVFIVSVSKELVSSSRDAQTPLPPAGSFRMLSCPMTPNRSRPSTKTTRGRKGPQNTRKLQLLLLHKHTTRWEGEYVQPRLTTLNDRKQNDFLTGIL